MATRRSRSSYATAPRAATTDNRLELAAGPSLALLRRLVEERVFPGAALALASSDRSDCSVITAGTLTYDPGSAAVTPATLYDLASVTKLVGALGAAIALVAAGELSLATRVCDVVGGWGGGAKDEVTLGHLLSHTSGLASHEPLFRTCSSAEAIRTAVKDSPLLASPGSCCVYSDLGIILLGELLEAASGTDLGTLIDECVLVPLALRETIFNPPKELRPGIAPTEDDPWRGTIVQGVVHDENAYAMGGTAAHAGLFAPATDVARFGRSLLTGTEPRLADDAVVRRFTERAPALPGPWAYGVRRLGSDPLFGSLLSPGAFGATGFTGTLLAVDPERGLAVALLSNRVHPTRENRGIAAARGLVLDTVMRAWDSAA